MVPLRLSHIVIIVVCKKIVHGFFWQTYNASRDFINKIQFLWHTNLMCRASKKSRVSDAGPFSELPRKARKRPALVDYWMFCTDTNVPTMSSRILPQCHPQSLGACVEPKVLHDVERLHQAKHVTNLSLYRFSERCCSL